MKTMTKASIGILVTVLGGALWGFSGTCGQFLFRNYGIDPGWLTSVRMMSAGVILLTVGFIREREHMTGILKSGRDIASLLIFSILGLMFCQLSYMTAISYSNAATATILQYLGPVIIMVLSCILVRKLPKFKEIAAVFLALSGTFLLATHGDIHSMVLTPKGLLWGILAAVGVTTYTMLPVKLINRWSSLTVTGYGMIIGGIALSLYKRIWTISVSIDAAGIAAMACIIVFGTVMAFSMYLYGVKTIGAVKASVLASVEPVSAAFFTVVWLHEKFQWIDAVGFLLIMTTVFLLAKKEKAVSCETAEVLTDILN